MAETQIIFRLDKKILKDLDESLKISGFKTRNEWFRAAIREFLENMERKRVLHNLKKLEVKGLKEEEIPELVNKWRSEKR
ncbi:MAG: ribbon-helix-helix domain-containing protein [Candidatus Methanoperedens sp.]|nr:ribbon-helix-helix domain-containing protein [Candidatus Methanoperedens sp.]